jgi:HEPN domain-containing protein
VADGISPPRTHDIGRLLRLCPGDSTFELLYESLDSTTYFAVEIRYGDLDLPPTREIEQMVRSVDRLLEWVATRIG